VTELLFNSNDHAQHYLIHRKWPCVQFRYNLCISIVCRSTSRCGCSAASSI